MSFSSPLGIVVCLGAILFGIVFLGGDARNFLDIASILLTVVPTCAALVIAFPFNQLAKVGKHFSIILGKVKCDPVHYIDIITKMSEAARSKGLLALEEEAAHIDDKFVKTACQMTADAMESERIEERLYGIIDATTKRHAAAWAIYDKGAAFAPAFGMVATLISLVNMLMNLNFADAGGVAALGVNMSMALITTFYGSLMANMIFLPLGNKLRVSHQNEIFCKELIIAGFLAIQRGDNSRNIKDMLIERLDPKTAAKMASE